MPEVAHRLNPNWQVPQAPLPRSSASNVPPFAFTPAPAFDRAPPPRRRAHWVRRIALALAALAVTAASAAVFAAASGGHALDRDRIATWLGFGIEQVSLSGHRFTSDSDLFDALDLKTARSLASFDAAATGKRFEQLPWVQSANITRVWPGELRVRITERTAFAIWETEGSAKLIDATGRSLGAVKPDTELALPRFAGEGAPAAAGLLWTQLGRHPALKARVVRAERIGGRRWTLQLTGGVRAHLPADGEAAALAGLANEPELASLIAAPGSIVDLRAPGRIAVRTAPAATPGPAPGGQ